MKKTLAMLLAVLMLLSLAACKKDTQTGLPSGGTSSPLTAESISGAWKGAMLVPGELMSDLMAESVFGSDSFQTMSDDQKQKIAEAVRSLAPLSIQMNFRIETDNTFHLTPDDDFVDNVSSWSGDLTEAMLRAVLPGEIEKVCKKSGITVEDYLKAQGKKDMDAFLEDTIALMREQLLPSMKTSLQESMKNADANRTHAYEIRDGKLYLYLKELEDGSPDKDQYMIAELQGDKLVIVSAHGQADAGESSDVDINSLIGKLLPVELSRVS